jgi:hypothetical protein
MMKWSYGLHVVASVKGEGRGRGGRLWWMKGAIVL